jgi:hypothetical protein
MRVAKASLIVIGLLLLIVALVAVVYGAIVGDVFGLFSFALVVGFFSGFTGEKLIVGIIVLLFTLVPQFGLTFFNWLKIKFQLVDKQAHDLIFVVCYIISAIALLVTGTLDLTGLEFSLANFLTIGTSIYGLSQLAFKRLFPKPTL